MMFGSDVEVFVVDPDGTPVPAHKLEFLPQEQAEVAFLREDYPTCRVGSIYRDGYAVEVNTLPDACRELAFENLMLSLQQAAGKLPEGYRLSFSPTVDIDLKELEDAPEDVQRFGCAPSRNAYADGREERLRANPFKTPFRSASAHIHVSPVPPPVRHAPDAAAKYVQLLDFLVGIPTTFLLSASPGFENEFKRRTLYGKAGEFRMTQYPSFADPNPLHGIEYRVCSAAIARFEPLFSLAWGVIRQNAESLFGFEADWPSHLAPDIQTALNTGKGLDALMKEWCNVIAYPSFSMDTWDAARETVGEIPLEFTAEELREHHNINKDPVGIERFLRGIL